MNNLERVESFDLLEVISDLNFGAARLMRDDLLVTIEKSHPSVNKVILTSHAFPFLANPNGLALYSGIKYLVDSDYGALTNLTVAIEHLKCSSGSRCENI